MGPKILRSFVKAWVATLLFLFFPGLGWPALPLQSTLRPTSDERLMKVFQAIGELEKAQLEASPQSLRSLALREEELNTYIAYRISTDPVELLKELRLKLLDGDQFEGKAVFDLSQENLPAIVPKEAVLFFSASFTIEGGRIRFVFHKIFLGTQELAVDFVSEMVRMIAVAHNAPAEGLNRSYDLPYGIKDIKLKKGKAIFYY